VRGRAGRGLAAGRRRFSALAGVLRGGAEETEGPLSAVAALPPAAAHPGRRRRHILAATALPGAATCGSWGCLHSWAASLGRSRDNFLGSIWARKG
jgi:hypothetical protein